jgi:hypothetical protein
MRVPTSNEHNRALYACLILRKAFPNNPTTTRLGTLEYDVDNCLCLLNELAGAHACNEPLSNSRYVKCLNAIDHAEKLAGQNSTPEYTVEYREDNPKLSADAIATTTTGHRYALMKRDGGWQRGSHWGATVDDAMRGAA